MITDADIKKLKLERFLTKKDFKKEIGKYATKDALEKLDSRTAEGFLDVQNQLIGIKGEILGIKGEISGIKGEILGIKGEISGMKEDITDLKHHMLTMEDNIVGEIHKLYIENKITATYKPRIENHEQRITKVESAVFSN
jgi:hypothetical protein